MVGAEKGVGPEEIRGGGGGGGGGNIIHMQK